MRARGPILAIVAVLTTTTVLMLTVTGSDESTAPKGALNAHPAAGSFVPDDTQLEDCSAQTCYEQAFGNLVYRKGPERAFGLFDEAIAEGGPIESGCHRIAHVMGGAALARNEGDVGQAFAEGSTSCWSGYYHGILEWALDGVPGGDLGLVGQELCSDLGEETGFLRYQCVHGLGHGMMITTGYDLPAANNACRDLATVWDRESCRGGVYMENIATAAGSPIEVTGKPRWLRDDDLLYPCNDDRLTPVQAKDQCYILVTSRVLEANGYDFRDAAHWCERAEQDWIETCFESLGRDASGYSTYEPGETLRLCRITGPYEGRCIWAAARDYTLRHAGTAEAGELCALAPSRLRPVCFAAIGTIVGTLYADPAERVGACRALSRRYAEDCVDGIAYEGEPAAVRAS